MHYIRLRKGEDRSQKSACHEMESNNYYYSKRLKTCSKKNHVQRGDKDGNLVQSKHVHHSTNLLLKKEREGHESIASHITWKERMLTKLAAKGEK